MLFLQIPTDGFACSIVFLCIFEFDIQNRQQTSRRPVRV